MLEKCGNGNILSAFSENVLHAGVAQLVERYLAKVAVDGSNPFARSIPFLFAYAGVAQLVERYLAKVAVDGSNPFARSIPFARSLLLQ